MLEFSARIWFLVLLELINSESLSKEEFFLRYPVESISLKDSSSLNDLIGERLLNLLLLRGKLYNSLSLYSPFSDSYEEKITAPAVFDNSLILSHSFNIYLSNHSSLSLIFTRFMIGNCWGIYFIINGISKATCENKETHWRSLHHSFLHWNCNNKLHHVQKLLRPR